MTDKPERFVALLTQHGKERVIAPLLREGWSAEVEVVQGFDTDKLGTFTRDVPRQQSQLKTVRQKASIAVERSGRRFGLGSEGAFTAGPMGLGAWNSELVMLLDAERGLEVVGRAQGPAQQRHGVVGDRTELVDTAKRFGFPEHGLLLRAEGIGDNVQIYKGLESWDALHNAFELARFEAPEGKVLVENDLRAHMNPTRMAVIEVATKDLVQRLQSDCPACSAPGFGVARCLPGLPCRACGLPTREAQAEEFACVACDHVEQRSLPQTQAEPGSCDFCNP